MDGSKDGLIEKRSFTVPSGIFLDQPDTSHTDRRYNSFETHFLVLDRSLCVLLNAFFFFFFSLDFGGGTSLAGHLNWIDERVTRHGPMNNENITQLRQKNVQQNNIKRVQQNREQIKTRVVHLLINSLIEKFGVGRKEGVSWLTSEEMRW